MEECAGLPCFRGLQPEHTAWVDAVASIEGRWSIRNDGHFGQISLFVARDNLSVKSIFLESPRDPAFTLGTILNHYGKPDCVQVYAMSDLVRLHYRHLQVLAPLVHDHFRPTSPVMSIVLGDFGPQDEHEPCKIGQREAFEQVTVMMDWRGFAPKQAYMQVRIPE